MDDASIYPAGYDNFPLSPATRQSVPQFTKAHILLRIFKSASKYFKALFALSVGPYRDKSRYPN